MDMPQLLKNYVPFKPLSSTLRLKAFLHYNEFEDCKKYSKCNVVEIFSIVAMRRIEPYLFDLNFD